MKRRLLVWICFSQLLPAEYDGVATELGQYDVAEFRLSSVIATEYTLKLIGATEMPKTM